MVGGVAEPIATTPEHIGPFRVLRAIAAGGMAEVYAVEDPSSGERFALKLLVAVKVALKRFNIEYEAMTRLNHPGIVRVYHYGTHQGCPWLTMELLRGTPAQPWMKQFGAPGSDERTQEVLRVGYHLAQALHYAHERGLVHRDLKSANVMILPDARVKLVDFGTAHLVDAMQRITADGEFVGTYAYASPEQLRGLAVDGRSDLYSLGILLYRLITGRRPFQSEENAALVRAHLEETPPDPRALAPGLPDGIADLIAQLLAKDRDHRPANAGLVARRLEELAGHPFATRSRLALHDPCATGREVELHRARAALTEAPGAAIFLVGEEGSDRARVLDTLVGEAIHREEHVFHCVLREDRDLEGLLGMLKAIAHAGASDRTSVRALTKLARANSTQLATAKVRVSLRRSVLETLGSIAGGQPVTIAVQGLENATSLTLEVLAGVRTAAAEAGLALRMVASVSVLALARGPELHRRFPDARHIELEPLTAPQVALAVGAMLGRRPPPIQISLELHQVTDGQPEYLEEAVRDLVASGGLEADDGNRLEWAGQRVEIGLPRKARTDAEHTLSTLPVALVRLLEAAVLLDDEVDVDLLGVAFEWTPDEVRSAAELLVTQQILRWVEPGRRLGWCRGRLRAVIDERLGGVRRVAHQLTLARAIRTYAPSAAQVRLLLAAGDADEALARCTRAAREALDQRDYRRAYAMLQPVIQLDRGGSPALASEAHLLYACCLQVLNPLDSDAARSLTAARKVIGGHPARLAAIDLAAARQAAGIGHFRNYEKFLKAAWTEADAAGDLDLKAQIALELAESHRSRGRLKEAAEWAEHARLAAIGARDRTWMGHVTVTLSWLALSSGDVAQAELQAGKAMQFFERERDRAGAWSSVSAWADALRRQGRFSEAISLLDQRLPEARASEDPAVYVRLLLAAAWCEVDLCRLGRAQELVDELAATVRRGELLPLRLESRLVYGRILLASGQYPNAVFVLQDTWDRARNAQLVVLAESARALLAEVHWHLRDRVRSKDLFQSALLGLKGTGDRLALADACAARARAFGREVDPEEIFKPVAELLETQPLPTLRLERLLAIGPWCRTRGDRGAMIAAYREAAQALNRLASTLNDTDRAALRVHPWSRRIRRGLR
jgi:tetratricopeptide (TPR) repeat protein